jgi:hypothetical protein
MYLDYLWRNADKFAAGFEVVSARYQQDLMTWEQTKMMAMFLHCLRFVFGGHHHSRELALWWSRRDGRVGSLPIMHLVWSKVHFVTFHPTHDVHVCLHQEET